MKKEYLGDAVYVEWDGERGMLKLTIEDGLSNPTNTIYLEMEVMGALLSYFKRLQREVIEAVKNEPST